MSRLPYALALVLSTALMGAACGDDDPPTAPTADAPAEITETFSGTLTRNGGDTYQFNVERAGNVSAQITGLTPTDAVVGLSLGPVSVQGCSAGIANDAATNGTRIIGNASAGPFCVRVFDSRGDLPAPVDYTLTVVHF